MRTLTDLEGVVRVIKDETADITPVLMQLRSEPSQQGLAQDLVRHPDPDVRLFIAGVLAETMDDDASPFLRELLRDSDSDVRSAAMEGLLAVDPKAARAQIPKLKRWLRSTEYYEPIDALWALADLRAIDAIPEIEAVAATWPPDRATARLAKIIVEVLRGNDEYVLSRIRAHDHVDMPWLARAAELLSADQAQAALRVISESQTVDPRCRHYCDQSLRRIRETAFRHRRLTSFDPERTTSR